MAIGPELPKKCNAGGIPHGVLSYTKSASADNIGTLGSFSRVQTYFNQFTVSQGIPDILGGFIPIQGRDEAFQAIAKTRQVKRCPGASEEPAPDGSNVFSEEEQRELDCVEAHRATGPIE